MIRYSMFSICSLYLKVTDFRYLVLIGGATPGLTSYTSVVETCIAMELEVYIVFISFVIEMYFDVI